MKKQLDFMGEKVRLLLFWTGRLWPKLEVHEHEHRTRFYHRQLKWLCFGVYWDLRDYTDFRK